MAPTRPCHCRTCGAVFTADGGRDAIHFCFLCVAELHLCLSETYSAGHYHLYRRCHKYHFKSGFCYGLVWFACDGISRYRACHRNNIYSDGFHADHLHGDK